MCQLKSVFWYPAGLLILTFLLQSCSKNDELEPQYSEMEMEILQLINQYRIIQGFQQLEMHPFLFEEAARHSNFMIDKNELSHENSNDRSDRVQTKLNSTGYAENVASGQKTATEAVTDWLTSDIHKQNIEGDYRFTGISAKRNKEGKYYFTQIFAQIP